jgi:hypothetical protein
MKNMEKVYKERDNDVINAELFGNDAKVNPGVMPFDINHFKSNLESMIKNAQTIEDLNSIGLKLNYAIDNKLNVDVYDYQLKAAKKMTEIYNNLKDEVRQ